MKYLPHSRGTQHGAMEFATPPVDLNVVRKYRLGRLRDQRKTHRVSYLTRTKSPI